MSNSLVSIILLNWNGDKYIYKCIEYLMDQTYNPLEIIIVDNGSTDGSIQKVMKQYPDFKYILNEKNLGFSAGMNQGIIASRGKYLIPLNQTSSSIPVPSVK